MAHRPWTLQIFLHRYFLFFLIQLFVKDSLLVSLLLVLVEGILMTQQSKEWFHFVMTIDGEDDELYFYVNGEASELNSQFAGNNGVESATGE